MLLISMCRVAHRPAAEQVRGQLRRSLGTAVPAPVPPLLQGPGQLAAPLPHCLGLDLVLLSLVPIGLLGGLTQVTCVLAGWFWEWKLPGTFLEGILCHH